MKYSNICCGGLQNGDKKHYKSIKKHILAKECLCSKDVYSFLVKGATAIEIFFFSSEKDHRYPRVVLFMKYLYYVHFISLL